MLGCATGSCRMHIVREVEFGTAVRFLGFSLLLPCLLVTRERRACAPHHVNLFWLLLLAYRIVQTRRGRQALLCTACGVLALQQHLQSLLPPLKRPPSIMTSHRCAQYHCVICEREGSFFVCRFTLLLEVAYVFQMSSSCAVTYEACSTGP